MFSHSLIVAITLAIAPFTSAVPANISSAFTHAHSHGHKHTHTHDRRGGYQLRNSYTASNFFDEFDFFTAPDPTHGFVSYQSKDSAWNRGLINTNDNQIQMGVDSSTVNPQGGRASVRVTSKQSFNHGLFIADIPHMPASACGSWPAFWMFGPDWPRGGEIDIIEGVNQQSNNAITLHTSSGCDINTWGSMSTTSLHSSNCNSGNAFEGCSTATQAPFGDSFNAGGGGVYAMQWESSGIYVWFFPRDQIPDNIKSGNPDTWSWGPPLTTFNGGSGCNIDSFFRDQNIIFNITFCGDWAGGVWGGSTCASKANTCEAYVAQNPDAFKNSFWKINSLKIYQQ